MNKLPSEVLVSIADYLPLTEKLEFARVCKNWNDALSQTTVYKKLTFKALQNFTQAVELCNKKQYIKESVQNLAILGIEMIWHLLWYSQHYFLKSSFEMEK